MCFSLFVSLHQMLNDHKEDLRELQIQVQLATQQAELLQYAQLLHYKENSPSHSQSQSQSVGSMHTSQVNENKSQDKSETSQTGSSVSKESTPVHDMFDESLLLAALQASENENRRLHLEMSNYKHYVWKTILYYLTYFMISLLFCWLLR
jgi:hypothetical protein